LICDKVEDDSEDYAVLLSSSNDYKATDLIIPDYVEFANGDVLPLKIIEENAFGSDSSDAKIYDSLKIGNNVEEIKNSAFRYNKITELKELPTSLKIIGDSVFAYQSTLYTNTTN
jgi:hypothetical protein